MVSTLSYKYISQNVSWTTTKKMGSIDSFNQRVAVYRVLRRTGKYWKTIFLDLLDIAAV